FTPSPDNLFDGLQVDAEDLDHGPILGPANEPVAGQSSRFVQASFDEVCKPEHAAKAIRIWVHVGDKGYESCVRQSGQETVGTSGRKRFAICTRVGAAARHGFVSSNRSAPTDDRLPC